jgi:serine phosphatase RsbU (regulator of sigma subunit)
LEAESEHLIEVPGDRKSIGGSANENNNFTRHDYVLSSGTSLFLWTDGYTDQSNSKSVRFGTRKLRDLITENAKLPLEELKNILITALKLHQGKAAQRDDILLIGVRL